MAKYTPAASSERQGMLADPESSGFDQPVQWQPIAKLKGSGQCECQGFESWTEEEKQMWHEGKLRSKWGIGQVSIRLPIRDPLHFIGLLYGYLPFVIPIWWALWALITWIARGEPRFFPAFGICIAVGFALVNELVTKQICKRTLPKSITDRPEEAVCKHPGMPSGHVMNAYTLMVWCFLEAAFSEIVYPEWLVVIVLVMGPVPWARVYNKDHTVAQVVTSACVATVMGTVAFLIRKTHYPDHDQPWDWYHANSTALANPYAPKFD